MVPQAPAGIDWRAARTGILIAGLLMGVATMFPLGFLLIIPGGALAVSRYQQKRGSYGKVPPSDGAKIGAVAGLVGYVVFAILAGIMFMAYPATVREPINLAIERAQTQNSDPTVQQIYQSFATPQGMALLLTIIMVIFFVTFLVFSSAGGAISAAISRRRDHRP
jgi:hypothetical protein